MLVSLAVRDLAVIDEASLEFGPGLTVLTGETGAGKSILLDALALALGARADSSQIRFGHHRATVTARFEIASDHEGVAVLERAGIGCSGEIVIRRQVGSDGRSRGFVNDEPVGVALLAELGATLVEIHGQHDQRALSRPEVHRTLLDGFAGHDALCAEVAEAHAARRRALASCEAMSLDLEQCSQRDSALRRDVEELDALDPSPDEEAGLVASRTRLGNAHRIVAALAAAEEALEGEGGADGRIRHAWAELERVRDAAAGAVDDSVAALDRALVELADAVAGLRGLASQLDTDNARLESIEERLFALRAAARRHGVPVPMLARLRARLAERLAASKDRQRELEGLRAGAEAAERVFDDACARLGASRREAARGLEAAVARELLPLRMEQTRFEVDLTPLGADARGASGAERVAFAVATDPAARLGPLNRVASGGELSRFMLALKVVTSDRAAHRALVFDEIDAGIGGAVSDAVGERLRRLGRRSQVLVVTHAAQLAARADRHIRIARERDLAGAATETVVLDDCGRREELARMLAGARITHAARAAAESLLKAAAA